MVGECEKKINGEGINGEEIVVRKK